MEEGKLINFTFAGIKEAISKYGIFPMIQPGGFVLEDAAFEFNEPATEEEIRKLKSHFNVRLPLVPLDSAFHRSEVNPWWRAY